MQFPFSKASEIFDRSVATSREADQAIRVAVYVDSTAADGLVATVRKALVPQTPTGLVRVARFDENMSAPKLDTDIVLVLTGGSSYLEDGVRDLVVCGAPVCVISESSVEVPFIKADTPILGLVCATDPDHLCTQLACWISERTNKQAAFAATFIFMRRVVSQEIIERASLTNVATALLFFIPGTDFPLMTLTQLDMMLKLASAHGYGLKRDRLYEAILVIVAAFVFKGTAHVMYRRIPHVKLLVRLLVAGGGTYGIGKALEYLYNQGVDYSEIDQILKTFVGRVQTKDVQPADFMEGAGDIA